MDIGAMKMQRKKGQILTVLYKEICSQLRIEYNIISDVQSAIRGKEKVICSPCEQCCLSRHGRMKCGFFANHHSQFVKRLPA